LNAGGSDEPKLLVNSTDLQMLCLNLGQAIVLIGGGLKPIS
jgi:hypothetical protein